MTDFLLELRSEEIPARMQARARDDLARLFVAELARAGVRAGEVVTYATPRRLALIARDLPEATAAVREEIKGPRVTAPAQALDGFLRKTGLTRERLVERDGIWFAVIDRPGRATADVLAEAIPAIVRAFPWPKSMRWGAASSSTESPRWVRPLQGVVALFGDAVVPCTVAGIASGAATVGHRFHHPGVITIGGAHDYVEKLRACHVVVDQDERATLIAARAGALAAEAGLVLVPDEGLIAENAGLTEWPVPLLGRFDAAFLDVPPEVIQLTARVNQKYFVCRDGDGALANAFVCVANIDAGDGGARIVEGNRKVLAARLSDARFFYDTDRKTRLEIHAEKLQQIVFHEKLGTVADKVERVAKLARWLCEEGIVKPSPLQGRGLGEGQPTSVSPADSPLSPALSPEGERETLTALAERAARLCKADLVTGMVAEFPELQGVMGGYYARAQGEPRDVWEAVRDHYKPVGQGDEVPTAPVTVAVSLADKLDTLLSFWFLNEKPTGSKDPFALRRAALAIQGTILTNNIAFPIKRMMLLGLAVWARLTRPDDAYATRSSGEFVTLAQSLKNDGDLRFYREDKSFSTGFDSQTEHFEISSRREWVRFQLPLQSVLQELTNFFADRLKVQQREAGVRHDLIDAVFALGGEDDLVRLLARVRALQAFVGTPDGANLLAGYKRAANILKKEGWSVAEATRHPGLVPGSIAPQAATPGEGWMPKQVRHDGDAAGSVSPMLAPAEAALLSALDAAEPLAAAAIAREDFEGAMAALASLRAPIDAFFEQVTVNDPDPATRAARLDLLARVRDAVHRVADFSRIEG